MGEQKTAGDLRRPEPEDSVDRLLHAVDELRALEREKRLQGSGAIHEELERRVEEQARAVYRLAQEGEAGLPGASGMDGESEP